MLHCLKIGKLGKLNFWISQKHQQTEAKYSKNYSKRVIRPIMKSQISCLNLLFMYSPKISLKDAIRTRRSSIKRYCHSSILIDLKLSQKSPYSRNSKSTILNGWNTIQIIKMLNISKEKMNLYGGISWNGSSKT